MVTKYCCCCENLKAAKILGIIGLVLYSICLIWSAFAYHANFSAENGRLYGEVTAQLQNLQSQLQNDAGNNPFLNQILKESSDQLTPVFEKARIMVILAIVYSILGLIANACLVAGATKSKKNLVMVWIVMAILMVILELAHIGIGVSLGSHNWVSSVVGLGFFIWQFLAVFGAYREIKEGRNSQA